MTQMASRVLQTLCPLQISPLALQNPPLKVTPRPHRWLRLRRWLLSNRQRRYLHQTSLSALPLLILNIPNRRPRPKHPIFNGRCPPRRRLLPNQISDQTHTFAQDVHPIPRRPRREGSSINLCTNQLAQMGPVAFNGRSFAGSLVQPMPPLMFSVK